jgi:hypothetical protein
MSKIGSYVLEQQIAEDEKSIPQIMQDMDDQVTDLFAAWDRFLKSESGTEINSNTAFKGEDNE